MSWRAHWRPGLACVTASMPVHRLPTLSGTASVARTRVSMPWSLGKRGSLTRSAVASGSFFASRKPITSVAMPAGHDPEALPRFATSVFTVGSGTSGPSSLMLPSSAPNIAVVFCTTQSRIGSSSVFDATTRLSSARNWSSAIRRAGSGVAAVPGLDITGPREGRVAAELHRDPAILGPARTADKVVRPGASARRPALTPAP